MHYIIALLLLGLLQNPDYQLVEIEYHNSDISTTKVDSSIWNIIAPYKKTLDADMNEVLCYAKTNLKKGQPESLLGNWTADLCLEEAQDLFQDTIDMVLFNNGGLRASLSEGNITKRDIYQLMPFENELVVLSLSLDDVGDLMNYLKYTGVSRQHFLNGLKKMSCLFMCLLRIILLMVAIKCAFSTTSIKMYWELKCEMPLFNIVSKKTLSQAN